MQPGADKHERNTNAISLIFEYIESEKREVR